MSVHRVDPLADPRWSAFVDRTPQSSVFHSVGWLQALRRTYGYEPRAYTTSASGAELTNAVVVSSIRSWLTGSRLVSGAFSDHCDPLFTAEAELHASIDALHEDVGRDALNYFELRTTAETLGPARLVPHTKYCRHLLDLRPPLDDLFAACHKDSIQRKIQRARREGLRLESGRSEQQLAAFYALLVATRRRHDLPPAPVTWYRNLLACLGDVASISVAFKDDYPVAAIFLVRHRDVLVYKYGASDAAKHALGGMPFLLWHAIEEGKRAGLAYLDLGRSDLDQHGLITFKDRFGAARSTITYFRGSPVSEGRRGWVAKGVARAIVRAMPALALRAAGHLLYRHVGATLGPLVFSLAVS